MSYDQRCEDLARIFLSDAPDGEPQETPENVKQLAQMIQDTVESFMSGNWSIG